jgi:hypothetical protein
MLVSERQRVRRELQLNISNLLGAAKENDLEALNLP